MTMYKVFKYPYLEMYGFEELPKGDMLKLSMNPYTGQVFVKVEKHRFSTEIALDIMPLSSVMNWSRSDCDNCTVISSTAEALAALPLSAAAINIIYSIPRSRTRTRRPGCASISITAPPVTPIKPLNSLKSLSATAN